jgi:hypothetical protein
VQNLQETSETFRGIFRSRTYFPRKNIHHPIISAIKRNHCVCLEWYILNNFNIFGENLLQFVIDELICKEKFSFIRITTIVKILNLMENGYKYRDHPLENFVKYLVELHQKDLLKTPPKKNYRYINLRVLRSEQLVAFTDIFLHI